MRVTTTVLASSVLLVGSLLSCLPASANSPCAGAVNSAFDSAEASLNCPQPTPTSRGGDKGSENKRTGTGVKPACVWVAEPNYQPGVGQKASGDGGGWYRKFCSFGKYNTLADFEQEMSTWDLMNMRDSNMMRRAGLDIRWFTTPPPQERVHRSR